MTYTADIYDPITGMNEILAATQKFDADRFLYALQYKHWDEQQMEKMAQEVALYRVRVETEYKRLNEFSQNFNKEFVTMNNKCFSTALTMLKKIRSGISETKKIFHTFCPRQRRNHIYHAIGNNPVSAYTYSYISIDTYELSLFKLDDYPPCINGLYNEMEKFFILLVRCIQLCKQVIADENKIRQDHKFCHFLFEEFKEKILKEIYDIIMLIPKDSEDLSEKNNPAIASRNKYDTDEAWAPFGFHNFLRKEVKLLITKWVLESEQNSDLTREEILLFDNDVQRAHKIRNIIMNFDKLLPINCKKKKLPAKMIQLFFQYIGVVSGTERIAAEYFNKMYSSSEANSHETVSYQAINVYKKEVLEDKDNAKKDFAENIKNIFQLITPLQKVANI